MKKTFNMHLGLNIKSLFAVSVSVPILLLSILYLVQDMLIFRPTPIELKRLKEIRDTYKAIEELELKTASGHIIRGWFLKGTEPTASTIIYFGGNSEEVSWMLDKTKYLGGGNLALFNYRGYGLSDGSPSEEALKGDSLLIYDNISKRSDVKNIIAMGRSFGTTIAVYLVANRPVEAVVLTSPLDSLTEVAKTHIPILPVSLILKYRFASIDLAPNIKSRVLITIATNDKIVPQKHSERLFESWGGEKEIIYIEDRHHNDISFDLKYWNSVERFLSKPH